MKNQGPPPCTEDPELWFTDDQGASAPRDDELRAQLTCLSCPLQEECLLVGLPEPYGIWGSYTPAERRQMLQGIPVRTRKPHAAVSESRKRIVRLFMSGRSVDAVARMLGTNRSMVLRHLSDEVAVLSRQSVTLALAS